MTTDIQQQANNRNLFSKMSTDFWQQARGPPNLQNLMQMSTSTTPTNLSNAAMTGGGGSQGSGSPLGSGGAGSGLLSPSNLHHLALVQQHHQNQVQQQQQQLNLATGVGGNVGGSVGGNNNNVQSGSGLNTPLTPNSTGDQCSSGQLTPNLKMALAQQQQQAQDNPQNSQQLTPYQQQSSTNPPQASTPGGSSTPDIKLNAEKFVNDFQIFMHKSAMQMHHARDLQRGVGVGLGAMGAEVKPHQCNQCLKSFSSNHQLVQHIRVHTGEKPYKCSYCDRRFKQLSHVQQHTRLHTGERPYKCHLPECGRAFIQLSNLQQHLRNHDAQIERAKNRPFHCNICGKGFATESSLRTHTSKQHAALIGGPNATSCPICHKLFLGGEALMEHMKHTHKDPNASGVATKRRSANHPCPVCGKHYVNEGSLRKHLACHPETSQLATSLRMWPCSVCQAVFTHETGLLTHMEHMRMDPKHQFAAQYVLSRAAAERRERDSFLAASLASGSGLLSINTSGGGDGGTNSMCPSPSAQSDSSSNNGRLSSAGSEAGAGLLNNNNNNNTLNSKLSVNDVLRGANNGHLHNQYGVDEMHANRMAIMTAAANIVSQTGGGGSSLPSNDPTAAVQAAVVNLAAAMRMNQVANQGLNSANGAPNASPPLSNQDAAQAAMNAAMRVTMADSMMRSAAGMDPINQSHHQQGSPDAAMRIQQQAEAILRSQAEALRLVSQAAAVAASNGGNGNSFNTGSGGNGGNQPGQNANALNQQSQSQQSNPLGQQGQQMQQQGVSPELSEALRLHEQRIEQALRLQGTDPRNLGFPLTSQAQHPAHNP